MHTEAIVFISTGVIYNHLSFTDISSIFTNDIDGHYIAIHTHIS